MHRDQPTRQQRGAALGNGFGGTGIDQQPTASGRQILEPDLARGNAAARVVEAGANQAIVLQCVERGMRGAVDHQGGNAGLAGARGGFRSEEHTSELQSLMRISYAVFCLKKKNNTYSTYVSHTIH